MKYAFENFIFDSEKLSLIKDGAIVEISFHDANLLRLLISQPEHIFSKEEILGSVWKNQVVSEQSVFQAISHLRSILGSSAIKTFARKGYQWQLPLKPDDENPVIDTPKKPLLTASVAAFVLAGLLLLVSVFVLKNDEHQPVITAGMIPFTMAQPSSERDFSKDAYTAICKALKDSPKIHVEEINEHYTYTDIAHGTVSSKKKLFSDNNSADVYFQLYISDTPTSIHTHYRLIGRHRTWVGDFETKDIPELVTKFTTHFEHLLATKLANLEEQRDRAVRSDYLLLHELYPDDLIIFHNLLAYLVDKKDFDRATLYANTLITKSENQGDFLHTAKAKIQLARILIETRKFESAKNNLEQAVKILTDRNNTRYQVEAHEIFAHLYDSQHRFNESVTHVENAIKLSIASQNPIRAAYLYIQMANTAQKYEHEQDKNNALHEALLLLDKHNASQEHYAAVYFHMANLSDDDEIAEKYYQRILAIFKNDFIWWERYAAKKNLSEIYIRQERWEEALALFDDENPLSLASKHSLANIYNAWGKPGKALPHAKEAFTQASLDQNSAVALEAASLLIIISQQIGNEEEYNFYQSYIDKHK